MLVPSSWGASVSTTGSKDGILTPYRHTARSIAFLHPLFEGLPVRSSAAPPTVSGEAQNTAQRIERPAAK